MSRRIAVIGLVFAGALVSAEAQWLNYRDPQTPRTKDGRPDLSGPTPRLNGRPDLSGVWQAERTPLNEFTRVLGEEFTQLQVDANDVTKHFVNIFWDSKAGDVPLRPEAAAIVQQRQKNGEQFQSAQCLPDSIPASMMIIAFKMIQTPREIVVLHENVSPARQIYTDGRSLPVDSQPSWMGYSVGRWQGDTLVVETIGIKERAWLDAVGHPRSEGMRITERYRRRDFGHMDLEVTFDDPKYYTRPFGFKTTLTLIPDSDILEYVCTENEENRVQAVK